MTISIDNMSKRNSQYRISTIVSFFLIEIFLNINRFCVKLFIVFLFANDCYQGKY